MFKIYSLFLVVFLMTSCSTKREILYFQNARILENSKIGKEFEPIFEVNDLLDIRVSSINSEVVTPFNLNSSTNSRNSSSTSDGYLVDVNGDIQFPVLGKINVIGKSRSELELLLTSMIKDYVTDAVVAVRLINFRVTVLGETGGETVVSVENERISIPELIARVGGIKYSGKRKNILIIREVNGERKVGTVDMTDPNIFENPFFYLRQNDIVYVEPTYKQVKSAGFLTSFTGILSIITSVVTLSIIFTR